MPTQCRLITEEELETCNCSKPGDMWYAPWYKNSNTTSLLSPEYYRDCADKRAPLVVVLPNGDYFLVDKCFYGKDHGWTVTGEAPNLTLSPSINCIRDNNTEGYHGWLQNGILSDDLEGRVYNK